MRRELSGVLVRQKRVLTHYNAFRLHRFILRMVTERQLFGAVNSLYYRRKLNDGIPELEEKIHRYLEDNEIDYLNIKGYQVMRNNGSIIIEESSDPNIDQLELPFHDKNRTS